MTYRKKNIGKEAQQKGVSFQTSVTTGKRDERIGQWRRDSGVSGTTLTTRRPQLPACHVTRYESQSRSPYRHTWRHSEWKEEKTKTLPSALRDAGIERPRLLQVADDAHSQAGRQRRVALFISTLLPLRRNLPPSSGCQLPFTHTRRETSKTLNHCMHTHARQFRRIYSFSQFIPPDNNNLRSSK